MRILHTADLHLGKALNEYSLLELQEEMLEKLLEAVRREDIDCVLLAGDIYDRSLPPKEAVELLSRFLTSLCIEEDLEVVMIPGNHDSPQRLAYAWELLSGMGLHIAGLSRAINEIKLEDVSIYPLAYMSKAQLAHLHGRTFRSLEEAMAFHLSQLKLDDARFKILMTHHYIKGEKSLVESDSERPLFLGNTENLPTELFRDFDYVALGHIHTQQEVSEKIYYSGAPMKYSKSEADRSPGYIILDTDSSKVSFHPLVLSKDLRVIRGMFKELERSSSQDLVFFELEDRTYVPDAMNRLKKSFPGALGLSYRAIKGSLSSSSARISGSFNYMDLFKDFYYESLGSQLDKRDESLVRELLERSSRETD